MTIEATERGNLMLASLHRTALSRALQAAAALAHGALLSILRRRAHRRRASIAQLNQHVLRDIGLQRIAAMAPRRGDGNEGPDGMG